MKPFYRSLTFWVAVCLWLGAEGSHLAQLIPGPWGLVAANTVAIGYAIARCLQKRAAGTEWKSILLTSEFAISIGTIAGNILEAISKVPGLSVQTVIVLSTIVGALTKILHGLAKPIAQTSPMDDETKKIMSNFKAPLILVITLGSALLSNTAQAQTPDRQLGGCFPSQSLGQICLGPSASIALGQYNLTTGKFSGGIMPGAGYGVTFAADQWYQFGIALHLNFKAGGGEPNTASPSLVGSFANYLRFGAGFNVIEVSSGSARKEGFMLFGLGTDVGGPTPVQAYRAHQPNS